MTQTLADYVRTLGKLPLPAFEAQVTCPVLVEIGFNTDSLPKEKKESFHTDYVNAAEVLSKMLTPDRREILMVQKRAESVFSGHISVGRTPNLDICIPRTGMSKFHAHFSRADDGTFHVTDKESKNGTFVDGQALRSGVPTPVADGSEVRFATHAFRFMGPARFHHLLQALGKTKM